jgi:cellulose synthase/poly-beta-1,6-N-acetylglucosamine synthase-like glycosyltransferase
MMLIFLYLLAAFTLFYFFATVFLHRGLKRLSTDTVQSPNGNTFSIVIAAHNEEAAIVSCLESVLSQTIGNSRFEVIVIDDRSSDATNRLVQIKSFNHSNLRIITVKNTPPGISPKKYAVSLGIGQARNEIIVFTDADCRVPPTWLDSIDRVFDHTVGLVQGITTYTYLPGMNAWFFGLQSLDFLSHGIVAAAGIGAGFPLNSNANNLAFRKAAFLGAGGYGESGGVVSGDDDLLLQKIWKSGKWQIRYMTSPGGSVETDPAPTLAALFEQRKRWGSKTVHYNAKQVVFLGGIFCFYVLLLLCMCDACFYPELWISVAGTWMVKCIGELLLLVPGTGLFNKKELRKFILPATIVQLPLVVVAVVLGVFGKFKWKGQLFGRTVRQKPDDVKEKYYGEHTSSHFRWLKPR